MLIIQNGAKYNEFVLADEISCKESVFLNESE